MRKTMNSVRQAIRSQICLSQSDLMSDVKYIRYTGIGRFNALSILCAQLGFKELEEELERKIKRAHEIEQQLLLEKIK